MYPEAGCCHETTQWKSSSGQETCRSLCPQTLAPVYTSFPYDLVLPTPQLIGMRLLGLRAGFTEPWLQKVVYAYDKAVPTT
jgi:hypothetical protein